MNTNQSRPIMAQQSVSPKIDSIKWGQVVTEDGNQYKDVKLFPGGSRAWDWNETGTHHTPGIQPADIEELLSHGAEMVVLSQGFHQHLQVCDETLQMLKDNDVDYLVLETGEAAEKYNELCDDRAAAALIHSTC